ncbi:hypothetical protein [Burkholderia gladioli]|uniref:hypothetical protein n=1 Tax=Burkholderia gladioli TaxID=28095 RepID=UPI001FC8E04C|nr:hypothetical protein [Burkholderia gladioli]
MLEKTVEAYLVERVRALGGTAYKFTSPARASVPDRIVILPPGRIFFVEVKRPGGKLTRGQEREHEHLRRLGADVRVLDSIGAINAFLNEVQAVAADGAELTGMQKHTIECADAWLNAQNLPTYSQLRAAVSPATADERAAFEAWFARTWSKDTDSTHSADEVTAMREGEHYDSPVLSARWEGWQAGRASQAAAPAELRYATQLAVSLHQQHYDVSAPNWKPLPDLMGVLTQIDNMTCGLTPASTPAEAREPDAYVPIHPRNGPLWASTVTSLDADRPKSYPVKPVYLGVPADAGEPIGSVRVNIVGQAREVSEPIFNLSRQFEALLDASPGVDFPLYSVSADAGEAVLTAAARDVLAERARQVSVEGWTPEHDDTHDEEELTLVAIVYAESAVGYHPHCPDSWPWSVDWFKLTTPRRDRVKAAALLLADIERIDRAEAAQGAQGGKGGEA